MLANPAANATADIGIAVSSISRLARLTRSVMATAIGGAPAWRANSRRRCRVVTPSVSARSAMVVRDWSGAYDSALAACMALQALAAILVALGPGRA